MFWRQHNVFQNVLPVAGYKDKQKNIFKMNENTRWLTELIKLGGYRWSTDIDSKNCHLLHDMNDWPWFMNNDSVSAQLRVTQVHPLLSRFGFTVIFGSYNVQVLDTSLFLVLPFYQCFCYSVLFLFILSLSPSLSLLLPLIVFFFTPNSPETVHLFHCQKLSNELSSKWGPFNNTDLPQSQWSHNTPPARFPLGQSPHQSNLLFM